LYGYFRSSRWNAANAISRSVLPMTQSQYGASLGGPVRANRTFFFGNFEQRLLNQSGLITIAPADVTAINGRLDAVAYPGPRIATGQYSNPVHYWTALGKLDHKFSESDQFTLRYNIYDANARNQRGAGALSAATASSHLDNRDQTIAASNVWTLSSRAVNETRGQFTHSDLEAPPSDLSGPSVSISGVAIFGRLSSSPLARRNRMFEVVDNLTVQTGAHSWRVGANVLHNDDRITFPRTVRGSYSFSSLANFLTGTYNNQGFGQTFGDPVVAQSNPNLGLYAQDEWRVHPRFVLNLGLRYDLQFLKTIDTDANNISPRGGFAWTPFASRRMVVRGSFGMFYDRVPLRAVANALLSAGNTTDPARLQQISVSLSPTQTGAPVFPNILSALTLPAGVLFNFATMQRDMQNAYSQQGSFEIEQQISRTSTISLAFQHVRGLHLIMTQNQNVPTCAAAGSNNGCRPNPAFANNSQYSSLGDSNYNGLHISFVQRPARWGSYRVSYAYSKALNNVGEFFFSQPIDHYNVWRDYGRSDDDQRHRLTFDGTLNTPLLTLSTLLQYSSSLPLNLTTGSNTVQGTPARPTINGAFVSRNAGVGFDNFNVNLRASRTFQLSDGLRAELMAESFNLLNHVNGATRNGVVTSSAFRQMTSVYDPRTFQFALRLGF
jgi:hypothetical protein